MSGSGEQLELWALDVETSEARTLQDEDRRQLFNIEFGDERMPSHFWSKVRVNAETGCWEWCAALNRGGYGAFWWESRARVAHRVAYLALVGEVPEGLHLDHLCRVRHCCNPVHLEPVTPHENVLRGQLGATIRRYPCHRVPDIDFDDLLDAMYREMGIDPTKPSNPRPRD